MKSDSNERLDKILRDWATARAASDQQLEALRYRILQDAEASAETRLQSEHPPLAEAGTGKSKWLYVAAGFALAASLFMAIHFGWAPKQRDAPAVAQSPVLQALSRERESQVVSAYQEVFGPSLSWVLERNGRADVGLSYPLAEDAEQLRQFVAIRLVLWSRSSSGEPWQEVRAVSVLAESERLIEIPSSNDGADPLVVWAYPVDEKMIAIDLCFKPDHLIDSPVEGSFLQLRGEYTSIRDYVQDGIQYRLLQAAEVLDDMG